MHAMMQNLKTRRRLLFAAIALIAACVGPQRNLHAEPPVRLDAKAQALLKALTPLRPPAIDRSLFDGRPVLVKFFASW